VIHRFYFDVHVHGDIAIGLREREVDVLTAQEDGTRRLVDRRLFDRATELDRVFVTYDNGFHADAARRQRAGIWFPGMVFIERDEAEPGVCIEHLELVAKVLSHAEVENLVIRVPFK